MRKATFSATFWRFVGDAKSKSCENIWHLVSRASSARSATHGKAPNLLENSFFIVKYVVV